jgi:hypothetical protein
MDSNSMSIHPTVPVEYIAGDIYTHPSELYGISLNMSFIKSAWNAYISLVPYHSDLEGLINTPLHLVCTSRFCKFDLSYSITITRLAPVPYDTNCLDYSEIGISSQEGCFTNCLTDFTSSHGMVLESNVMWKDIYGNSTLVIIPWYMKTLRANHTKVDKAFITRQKLEHDKKPIYDRLISIFDSYKQHWTHCSQKCSRQNCFTETYVSRKEKSHRWRMEYMDMKAKVILMLFVHPPKDQVVIVTSQPKQTLLDFLVYITSCFSFWFGFSVLGIGILFKEIFKAQRFVFNTITKCYHSSQPNNNQVRPATFHSTTQHRRAAWTLVPRPK